MKNRIVHLLALAVLLIAGSCQGQSGSQKLTADLFEEKMSSKPDRIILDVRTKEEYAQGHLASANNIDYYGSNFKDQLNQLDKSKPVFVYCKAGTRSGASAKILTELGFKEVYDLRGGYDAWVGAKKPVAK